MVSDLCYFTGVFLVLFFSFVQIQSGVNRMATRCCGFSVIISKSHTFLLKRITAEVFSPLTLMADFHGPCSLLGVCFSWQGQSPLPCFRELFNYKSSTLLLLPFLSLFHRSLCYPAKPSKTHCSAGTPLSSLVPKNLLCSGW